MADVKLRIEVNPDKESEFLNSIINDVGTISNASYKTNGSSAFVGLDNVNESGREMLSWAKGVLKFTADGYLSNNGVNAGKLVSENEPDMFVWGAVPPNGEYSVKLTFKGTENLKDIIVYGDPTANQFPTEAIIDGKTTIYSDDYRLAINLGTESETHTIEFTKWNRPNYNACLTQIMVMMRYYEVGIKNGLKSLESLSQSTAQPENIYYGVISNTGSGEIVDIDGEISEMVNADVISNSNLNVEILVNNNQIQKHITVDSNYTNNKVFNIELENQITKWSNISIKEKKYSYDTYLSNIFRMALKTAGCSDSEISEMFKAIIPCIDSEHTVAEYLAWIVIPQFYQYTNKTNALDLINEICQILQVNIIENDDGKKMIISSRPIITSDKNILVIPNKYIQGTPTRNLILDNKYDNIKYIKQYLTYSEQTIFNNKYIVRNNNGELDWSILGENVHTINVSNNNFLCFFKNIEGQGVMTRYDNIYINNSEKSAMSIEFLDKDNNLLFSRATTSFYSSNKLKEDYNFVNDTGSVVVLDKYSTPTNDVMAFRINISASEEEINKIYYVNISLTGNVYYLDSIDYQLNENANILDYNYNSTILTDDLSYRPLKPEVKFYKMYDVIENTILNDYKNGIHTAQITTICKDIYDVNGNLAKVWSNGEILQVGDIVRVDKDNNGNSRWNNADGSAMYWKITGRKFRYAGVPLIDLELQEAKKV